MVTVHMIGNAHIDPVWLWRRPAGVVEVLSTCRAAADLIDRNPDFVFTRGEAWVYEQVERHDPALFERIKRQIQAGRWKAVGGWYIQPDCNLPLADSFRMQMDVGLRYFRERLGVSTDIGYNVDSFGHHAFLPTLLRERGFRSYVMMRPGPHELALPSALFRWRSPDGGEVLTWRIAASYASRNVEELQRNVQAALAASAPGLPHVMCFYGVGDHGGGPSQEQIEWIRSHARGLPGAMLEFSDPERFFAAIAAALPQDRIPVVTGELQHHAVGCYSVVRGVKAGIRRAERALERARITAAMAGAEAAAALDEAWKPVLFNQFHDIYGGSSVAEAYTDARDQLGRSCSIAEEVTQDALLRLLSGLPPDPMQRIVVYNPSDRDFDGAVEHEPWLDGSPPRAALLDSAGAGVPCQLVREQAVARPSEDGRALLWRARIPARGTAVYRLAAQDARGAVVVGAAAGSPRPRTVTNGFVTVRAGGGARLFAALDAAGLPLLAAQGLQVRVLADSTDTWSHGVDRYGGRRMGSFHVTGSAVEESGPIRATLRVDAAFGRSRLCLRVRLLCGDPALHIEMDLAWQQRLEIAKLVLPFHSPIRARVDGVPGGSLRRPNDGRENPFVDWTLPEGGLGVVAPDCWALDGEAEEIRLTLVRSPVFAWHDPRKMDRRAAYRYTDQGEHSYRFVLVPGATVAALERASSALTAAPVCLDWTLGMEAARGR